VPRLWESVPLEEKYDEPQTVGMWEGTAVSVSVLPSPIYAEEQL